MKRQSYKTFLINEANRLSGLKTRSLVKLIKTDNFRVKAHVAALMIENDSFLINSSNVLVKEVSKEAFKIKMGIDSEYSRDVFKYKNIYKNYIDRLESKKELMDLLKNSKKLYSICKEKNINYGNAFNFFINKVTSSLTEVDAMEIIIESK